MIICQLCGRQFKVITNTHLSLHRFSLRKYVKRFGSEGVGFFLTLADIPKTDSRYIKWRSSLMGRNTGWSAGLTKYTHPGIAKISRTFKRKGIDNFSEW